MQSLLAGNIYSHSEAPERQIQILNVPKGRHAHVEYVSTTNKDNRGAIGRITKEYIIDMYNLIFTVENPSWEV